MQQKMNNNFKTLLIKTGHFTSFCVHAEPLGSRERPAHDNNTNRNLCAARGRTALPSATQSHPREVLCGCHREVPPSPGSRERACSRQKGEEMVIFFNRRTVDCRITRYRVFKRKYKLIYVLEVRYFHVGAYKCKGDCVKTQSPGVM